jgi:hypothetical protein
MRPRSKMVRVGEKAGPAVAPQSLPPRRRLAMSSESERRTRAEFDRQYEAGIQAALKRCRGLAQQIESELCNKRLDFDSVLSLADFRVALEHAAGVLKQR